MPRRTATSGWSTGPMSWRPSQSASPRASARPRAEAKEGKQGRKITKRLKKGNKAKAKLKVKLSDGAGNGETEKLTVKLKR